MILAQFGNRVPYGNDDYYVTRRTEPCGSGAEFDINHLLKLHRPNTPDTSWQKIERIQRQSWLLVVKRFGSRSSIYGMAVVCPVYYFSFEQIIVRDYSIDPACDGGRELMEKAFAVVAKELKCSQAFLTNSDPDEQALLEAHKWQRVATQVFIKKFEEQEAA